MPIHHHGNAIVVCCPQLPTLVGNFSCIVSYIWSYEYKALDFKPKLLENEYRNEGAFNAVDAVSTDLQVL